MYEFKPEDAYDFARHKGIRTKEHGSELQWLLCPYCHGGSGGKDKGTFSINLKTGLYKCLRSSCDVHGHFYTLAKDFDFPISNEFTRYQEKRSTYRKLPQPKEKIIPKASAIRYLNSRGISEKTVNDFQITAQKDNDDIICFPVFNTDGKMVNVKYRNANYNKETKGQKEWFEKNCEPYLYGINTWNGSYDRFILTEGQIDALSCYESGIENAFSVIGGKTSFTWFPACYEFISKFEELIIFGDNEHGEITLLKEMQMRFKKKIRCVRAEDYKDCKDANEILQKYGSSQIVKCIQDAEVILRPQIVEMADVEYDNSQDDEKIPTGINQLDRLLYGGLPLGGVTLLTGKAGHGKSTLGSQIIINALQNGYKSFIYSGEMPNGMVKKWLDYQIAGRKHVIESQNRWGDRMYVVSKTNREEISEWYRGKLFVYNNMIIADDKPMSLTDLVEEMIVRYGVKVVLIDNLMTAMSLEGASNVDKYERQSQFVNKLSRIALNNRACIILVAHKRKNNFGENENDEIAGSSDIGNLALATLTYEKGKDIDDSQRCLKVSKNRLTGRVNTNGWVLEYEEKSKRVYGADDDVDKEYGWQKENDGFDNVDFDVEFMDNPFV